MSKFWAFLNRMKHIERWSLMRSTERENIMEHTMGVSFIAHALAVIGREYYGSSADVEKTLLLSLYHEASEVITGDLPTPIKYFNQKISSAYKQLELYAADRLVGMLPPPLQGYYSDYLKPNTDSYEYGLVKAADKISALIKCIEERKSGNSEFKQAEQTIRQGLDEYDLPEVKHFLTEILPFYELTLDEL